jgi:dihydroorotate dehydrogenase
MMGFVGGVPPLGAVLSHAYVVPGKPVQAFGLTFPNPVGLAAGYDKDGTAWRGLACLGFGHIEIGTVTLRPQDGNPKPRLYRLPQDHALINRMGFPGKGAEFVAGRLSRPRKSGLVLGVNLGKNKDTPLEEAARDYLKLIGYFAPLADYLAINVSSPNTIGLRRLQSRRALEGLLTAACNQRREIIPTLGREFPLLVKLAPDLTDNELDNAMEVICNAGVDGVIATNTTLHREGVRGPMAAQAGGLSGAPLRERSTQVVRKIYARTSGSLPIIGVGGIMNSDDARAMLDAGAALVQVYTGLVYAGPGLVRQIIRG